MRDICLSGPDAARRLPWGSTGGPPGGGKGLARGVDVWTYRHGDSEAWPDPGRVKKHV